MEDKRKKLYQIFLDNKLITEKTSLERWMRMSEREAEKIFNLGKENKLFGQETEAIAFTSLWAEDPVKKKRIFGLIFRCSRGHCSAGFFYHSYEYTIGLYRNKQS